VEVIRLKKSAFFAGLCVSLVIRVAAQQPVSQASDVALVQIATKVNIAAS
jgi:hypothetical protein